MQHIMGCVICSHLVDLQAQLYICVFVHICVCVSVHICVCVHCTHVHICEYACACVSAYFVFVYVYKTFSTFTCIHMYTYKFMYILCILFYCRRKTSTVTKCTARITNCKSCLMNIIIIIVVIWLYDHYDHTVLLKCYVALARVCRSSDKLRKHSIWYNRVIKSRWTACILETRTQKTGSFKNSSSIIQGVWDLVSVYQITHNHYQSEIINAMLVYEPYLVYHADTRLLTECFLILLYKKAILWCIHTILCIYYARWWWQLTTWHACVLVCMIWRYVHMIPRLLIATRKSNYSLT